MIEVDIFDGERAELLSSDTWPVHASLNAPAKPIAVADLLPPIKQQL